MRGLYFAPNPIKTSVPVDFQLMPPDVHQKEDANIETNEDEGKGLARE
jgi:hypothetical protein